MNGIEREKAKGRRENAERVRRLRLRLCAQCGGKPATCGCEPACSDCGTNCDLADDEFDDFPDNHDGSLVCRACLSRYMAPG